MLTKDQKGAALVEFAIVLPMLLIFAVGIIEIGIALYNKQVITNASREGVRAGVARKVKVVNGNTVLVPIDEIVQAYCQNHLITFDEVSPSNPVTTFPETGNEPASSSNPDDEFFFNRDFSVKVTYDYQLLVSQVIGVGPTITLAAETQMTMQ